MKGDIFVDSKIMLQLNTDYLCVKVGGKKSTKSFGVKANCKKLIHGYWNSISIANEQFKCIEIITGTERYFKIRKRRLSWKRFSIKTI
jgi:hypothetical protein